MLFVDYKGCFEAVSHQPLLQAISKKSIQAAKIIESMVANNVMAFTLGSQDNSKNVLRLKSRRNKSVEQGGILSPFLFNIFDTLIMEEFERQCSQRNIDAIILGYADDHVICLKNPAQAAQALQLFLEICRSFGMILEMSKTEFVVPANKICKYSNYTSCTS